MLAVIGSLVIGVVVGFLGQRSRMCFVGGFRDLLLAGDKQVLKGAIAFFASAWLTIWMVKLTGLLLPEIAGPVDARYASYPSFAGALLSRFGIISIIGGLGLGLFSTLAGGCPLRQHVMAGQGRIGSMVYLAGFYAGIILYYAVTVKLLAGFL